MARHRAPDLNSGTIFKIRTDGNGYAVLKSFPNSGEDGVILYAGLTLSGTTLYGVTSSGGDLNGDGTVFKLNTDGTGFTVLTDYLGGPVYHS